MSADVVEMPKGYRSTRRRSEAELLTFDEAAKTSKYVKQLSLNETSIGVIHTKINKGLQRVETIDSEYSNPPPQNRFVRRSSLSVLEESHFKQAMDHGGFQSEAERAKRARRKSFDKCRKRSTDDDKRSKKERKGSSS